MTYRSNDVSTPQTNLDIQGNPIKFPRRFFFKEFHELILKFIWESQLPPIAEAILN